MSEKTVVQNKLAMLVGTHQRVEQLKQSLAGAQRDLATLAQDFCNAAMDHNTPRPAIFTCGDVAVLVKDEWYDEREPVEFFPVVECGQE